MKDLAIFGISTFMSLVSSAVIAKLYVWPRLRTMDQDQALVLLVAPHMFFRFIGLSFLVPGVVSPSLPAAFAVPAAYGDFVAGILAVVATVALSQRVSWAVAVVWLFNIWGAADLLFAFYQGPRLPHHQFPFPLFSAPSIHGLVALLPAPGPELSSSMTRRSPLHAIQFA